MAILFMSCKKLFFLGYLLVKAGIWFRWPQINAGVSEQQFIGESIVVFEDVYAVINEIDLS